jgi:hypothetical protein
MSSLAIKKLVANGTLTVLKVIPLNHLNQGDIIALFWFAAEYDKPDVMRFFLEKVNDVRDLVVHLDYERDSLEVWKILVEIKFPLDKMLPFAKSPETFKFLIENGADPKKSDLQPSLVRAFLDMQIDMINLLIANGAKLVERYVHRVLSEVLNADSPRTIERICFAFANGISFAEFGVYALQYAAETHNVADQRTIDYLTKEVAKVAKETLRAMLSEVEDIPPKN